MQKGRSAGSSARNEVMVARCIARGSVVRCDGAKCDSMESWASGFELAQASMRTVHSVNR
jgi:hypothetical protein